MRMIFSVFSLLIVVAVIGFMAKKQIGSISAIKVPGAAASSAAPTGNAQQQSQRIQQQFKAAAEAAMQPARVEPETR